MFKRLRKAARAFTRRFGAEAGGNVAIMFGLALPLLIMMTVGGIDLHHAAKVRADLQDALDAAALAAARSPYTDDARITEVGMAALRANMPGYFQVDDKGNSRDEAAFALNSSRIVEATARVQVKTIVANIILPPYGKILDDYLPVSTASNVNRASRNVEVALALDITGSMKDQPLKDLKAAAKELIEIVVQDQQEPFYSKAALVPYAVGVNLATSAAQARGAIPGPTAAISAIAWKSGEAKSITGLTRANPAVISSTNHGFANGDIVWIADIRGMTQMNNRALEVVNRQANSFQVRVPGQSSPVSSSAYSSYSSGGTIQKCLLSDCSLRVTANGHGRTAGSYAWIDEVKGMTEVNKTAFPVSQVTANTFSIGVVAPAYKAYTSGGGVWCTDQGCQAYRFRNDAGGYTAYEVSTCVSERTGSQAYTDAAPTSGARVGRSYTDSAGNPCPQQAITPLTNVRQTLNQQIDALKEGGSTAGQIGIAWAWYMVSPNFNSLWPGASQAAAYDPGKTLKAVVLMTDGEFNTPFCQDVIAKSATTGSGGTNTHINCNATNGDPFTQSVSLCTAMKQQDVVVYTVGFNLNSSNTGGPGIDTALEVLEACATNKSTHFFKANSGADLKEAFKAIGRDITRLRISK